MFIILMFSYILAVATVVAGLLLPLLDLRPGVECKVVCNPGWIPSPGQSFTRCEIGGQWSSKLQCEEPLLIIAGGFGEQNGPKALNNIEVNIKY